MIKRLIAIASTVISLAITVCTAGVLADNNVKYPVIIKDVMGRTITVKREPARIISLSPASTEILFALGLGPKIVAVTTWCDYPAEAKKKEKIGDFVQPNIEKIVQLKPDLIIGAAGVSVPALKQLDDLGFPTVVNDARNFTHVKECVTDIARLTNTVTKGKAVIDEMDRKIDKITKLVKSAKTKPKVYYEVWGDPLMTAGPGTFIDNIIKLAGGINVAGDAGSEWPNYSLEVLVQKNPDVVLFAGNAVTAAQIRARKGWETIKAVKTGRVIKLPDENAISRPTPRLVDGLEDVAKAIHPELF